MSDFRRFAAGLAVCAGLFVGSTFSLRAAEGDGRLFTQTPELAASQVKDQPVATETAPAAPAKPKAADVFADGPVPQWIWGPDADGKYALRASFAGGAKSARLKASCDNVVTVYVNGQKVATSDSWQSAVDVDVTKHVKPGENEVVAEVSNQGGPSGFVFKLALTGSDGKTTYVVSDDSWKAASSREAKDAVAVKTLGKLGIQPWGDVFSAVAVAGGSSQPRDVFNVLPGFQVEKLFTVPKEQLGSWVNITADPKGRLIVSDQGNLGLCRVTPPPIGSSEPTKVEKLDVKISGAQGLLFAFDSLYVCCNGGPGSGLYRVRDTDGDDQFDEVVKLKDLRGGGEHGPHALRLSPDGKSIYVIGGNHTKPPFDPITNAGPQTMGGPREQQLTATLPEGMSSRIAANWDEDVLIPRQWDANGHAVGILAPGGWIASTDPEGKSWEIVSVGYRNQYDMAFNADGELFAYDSDMEWDMGLPWYRPTRVNHVTSGSEFGWRSGTACWPHYFADSLPPLIDIGPGSPVGVDFGYGTKFPAKYQKALYICDWTFGTMYAIHIEPDGATYKAVKEEFVSRTPLPLTDVTVGKDGALYFTIGGRGAQSELFRVTYVGKESTAPAELRDAKFAELRKLRREIEACHGPVSDPAKAIEFLLPHLGHDDRFVRVAARVAIERLPLELWQDRVLSSKPAQTVITGAIGLARMGSSDLQPKILAALNRLDGDKLTETQRLELLRAYELAFIRLGPVSEADRTATLAKLDPLYPAATDESNRELVALLVHLRSPNVVKKTLPLLSKERDFSPKDIAELLSRNPGYGGAIRNMLAHQPDAQQIHYVFALRTLKEGWTLDERKEYFRWFEKARAWAGGNSFQKFLTNIDNDAFASATDAERLAIESSGARKPYTPPPLPKPQGPGKDWTAADVIAAGEQGLLKGRDFKNGQKAYAAARCVVCHRFAGDGGATGPDLTQLAGRFNLKDLTDSIVEPSKVVSDQYKATIVETKGGEVHTGRVVGETEESITIATDPEVATKTVVVRKSDIESQQPSATSLMPKDLIKPLNENEVLDLLAYLLSRGNPGDAMFRK